MSKKSIDFLIRALVADLNQAGFETFSSCQGKTCLEDFEKNRHCDHSFISFQDETILSKRKAKAKKLGLYVYNGNYSVTALSGHEIKPETIIARNVSFVANMRALFNLR